MRETARGPVVFRDEEKNCRMKSGFDGSVRGGRWRDDTEAVLKAA